MLWSTMTREHPDYYMQTRTIRNLSRMREVGEGTPDQWDDEIWMAYVAVKTMQEKLGRDRNPTDEELEEFDRVMFRLREDVKYRRTPGDWTYHMFLAKITPGRLCKRISFSGDIGGSILDGHVSAMYTCLGCMARLGLLAAFDGGYVA